MTFGILVVSRNFTAPRFRGYSLSAFRGLCRRNLGFRSATCYQCGAWRYFASSSPSSISPARLNDQFSKRDCERDDNKWIINLIFRFSCKTFFAQGSARHPAGDRFYRNRYSKASTKFSNWFSRGGFSVISYTHKTANRTEFPKKQTCVSISRIRIVSNQSVSLITCSLPLIAIVTGRDGREGGKGGRRPIIRKSMSSEGRGMEEMEKWGCSTSAWEDRCYKLDFVSWSLVFLLSRTVISVRISVYQLPVWRHFQFSKRQCYPSDLQFPISSTKHVPLGRTVPLRSSSLLYTNVRHPLAAIRVDPCLVEDLPETTTEYTLKWEMNEIERF